jgi:hypothetical protein
MVIALASLLESIGLIFMVGLSNAYGIRPTFFLSSLGLVFLVGLNIFFSLLYFRLFKHDASFKHWEREYGSKVF